MAETDFEKLLAQFNTALRSDILKEVKDRFHTFVD